MKRGKKYIEAAKLIERGNLYEKEEAVALVKKAATAKFDETIEAHIRTGCDGPLAAETGVIVIASINPSKNAKHFFIFLSSFLFSF